MKVRCIHFLACAVLLAACTELHAADYAREQRWADEILPAIVVGDPVWLELKSRRKFLALYARSAEPRAGVIVVHGLGVHPDWGLINVLRSHLAEQGYATLSVQMPVLAADARADQYTPTFPEAAERLAAAVAYLRGRGFKRIGVVSHSLGSRMTNYFLAAMPDAGVDAWVAVGLSGVISGASKLKLPVLDLYGEKDFPAVLEAAGERAEALKGLRGSGQTQVEGADHFFVGREQELVKWSKRFFDRALR